LDAVALAVGKERTPPSLVFRSGFHWHDGYQEALAGSVRRYWQAKGQGDHLLLSYHGVPLSFIRAGDPYARQCRETTLALVRRLGLGTQAWTQGFQSRFGRGRWLGPATVDQAAKLGRLGVARLDVICPSFVSDCLETLEEIQGEVRQAFLQAGGKDFRLIPCLGDDPAFLESLADLVRSHDTES